MASELQPDVGEVLQEEPYNMPVTGEVSVCGPVRTQELPRKAGATKTRTVGDTQYVCLLDNDYRRGFMTVMSMDAEMYFGFTEASMQASTAMSVWPKAVPLTLPISSELWVQCAESGKTTRVSVTTGLWAAG
ncbi:hypothetical protein ACIPWE_40265 [Streptomyces sp. NPDC090073]|uniref:hypothetical protein n=1 Tax=Streptomyces sp. NPDC090073 TaxID=3365936 RepID=UPI00382A182A